MSSLARGRGDDVRPLLDLADRTRAASDQEIAYWRGRFEELHGSPQRAVEDYLHALESRPFHPFARAARSRLDDPALLHAAEQRARQLAHTEDPLDLWRAAQLTHDADERAHWVEKGRLLLSRSGATKPWLQGGSLDVPAWPVWGAISPERAEDQLAALGLLDEVPGATSRYFSLSDPLTGLTGALLLGRDRSTTRKSIAIAETIFRHRPRQVPFDWVAADWIGLLYPLPWPQAIRGQAAAHGLDPAFLAAIVREESRFDPRAVSTAAARGLSQLVLPTARRLAREAGVPTPRARDLSDPVLSILLGSTYLAELSRRFRGEPTAVAAAYNAGEDQTALWQHSCYTTDPLELLSKIGFGETRAYVTRVLESRAVYRLLGLRPGK